MEYPAEIQIAIGGLDGAIDCARELRERLLSKVKEAESPKKVTVADVISMTADIGDMAACAVRLSTFMAIIRGYMEAVVDKAEEAKDLMSAMNMIFDEDSLLRRLNKADVAMKGSIILLAAAKSQIGKINFVDLLPK